VTITLHPLRWANAPDNYSPKWIVENVWQGDGVNFLFGPPKHGRKSSLRRYLLACALTGTPAFDTFEVRRTLQNPLLLIIEDHPGTEKYWIRRSLRAMGFHGEPTMSFLTVPGFHLDARPHLDALIKLVEAEGHDFVSIDPLVNFHGKDENDNSAMGQVTGALHYLRQFCGVSVIHHNTKPSDSGGFSQRTTGQRMRGGGVLGGAANVTIESRPAGPHRVKLSFEVKTPSGDTPDTLEVAWNRETGLWGAETAFGEDVVLAAVARQPGLTRDELVSAVGRNRQKTLQYVSQLLDADLLRERNSVPNGGQLYCANVAS